ncbi:MAG: DUF2849 domain-containing protein [Caulobacteraceae bacterium]|nr:DUF2849 domain-containing protein [Caulobacteraceae bacterium]
MKLITANRLSDGRVIYVGEDASVVEDIASAALFEGDEADAALIAAASQPGTFVNAYLVEVTGHTPSGRDRLKETIRSAGPTVGNSLNHHESA